MLDKIAESWATPTGLMVIFGCVVWGVQLNFAVMALTERVGDGASRIRANEEALVEISRNNVETAVIIEHLQDEIQEMKSGR